MDGFQDCLDKERVEQTMNWAFSHVGRVRFFCAAKKRNPTHNAIKLSFGIQTCKIWKCLIFKPNNPLLTVWIPRNIP